MNWLAGLIRSLMLLIVLLCASNHSYAQQRFPKPEFKTEYTQPVPEHPAPRSPALEFLDLAILVLVMSLTAWVAIRRRSRYGILILTIFSLFYFGFYKQGCICSVGSIQNVALALADPTYRLPLVALLVFLLPLIFSLFFGRVFCAAACPLGAIQDLIIFKPINLPVWLRKSLSILPWTYLGLAVLFATTGTDFIICRYDPFIGIYRLNGKFIMILLGIAFLLMGLFVARPYCRFICPYGALLSLTSRFSKWHLSIYPTSCVQCKLCTTACPFEAIDFPDSEQTKPEPRTQTRRFLTFAALIPVLIAVGMFIGSLSHVFLSRANSTVYLAELLIAHPELRSDPLNLDIQTFLASGQTLETLTEDAATIREKFRIGAMILGGFLGLVIGLTALNQLIFRRKEDYQANRADCYSCARCLDYCPVDKTVAHG
ncbi:MAG: 4Fe-4S binding protein [Bacteroidales bacterium]